MFERPQLRNGFERLSAALLLLVALGAVLAAQWLVVIGMAVGLVALLVVRPRRDRRRDSDSAPDRRRTLWAGLLLAGVLLAGAFRLWGPAGTGLVIAGVLLARPRRDGQWTTPTSKANWAGYALVAGGLGLWALNGALIVT